MPRRIRVVLFTCLTVFVPLVVASGAVRAQPQAIANLTTPTIAGSPVVGNMLSAKSGTWSAKGPPPTYTYQWQACNPNDPNGTTCLSIANATASTYKLLSTDANHTIRVKETGSNKFSSASSTSLQTAAVTNPVTPPPPPPPPPPDTTPPTQPGNFAATSVSQTSVATSWTASTDPDSPVAGYTVYRGTTQVNTPGTSYTFTGLACGTAYTFYVDAYDAVPNHSTKAQLNVTTAACTTWIPPTIATVPVISGTAQVGSVLTTSNGTWNGTTPMTYAYKWFDCDSTGAGCTQITTATTSMYTLTTNDQGHTIKSQVTATNNGGSATATSAATSAVQAPPQSSGLHVSGNQLLDSGGHVVHLQGVNRSGPEYACIQGWGIFDGPSDAASVSAMASWRVNIVRIPLNEDCWLGINGVPSAYSGANYQNAIVNFVNLLHQNGMDAELSLIWGAPGTNQATYQPAAPDADHSPAFWSSLAATFKGDSNVILAPWGETTVSADCFLNGGNCGAGYTSAGMQQAVSVMRQAGYNGVIAIPGIDYANNLTQWLSHEPSDPQHQLIAEAHIYGKNTCDTTSCFDSQLAPVAAQVPLIFGETGETYDDSHCGSTFISTFMNWADAHGVGYEAWVWDTWGTCLSLISDYNGTPANAYASWVKSHYAGTTTPPPPATTTTPPPTTTTPPPATGQVAMTFDLGWEPAPPSAIAWNHLSQIDLFALQTQNGPGLDKHLIANVNLPGWVGAAHSHGVQAFISIGGSDDNNWSYACNDTNRAAFVQNLVAFATSNGFDGIDLDIEDGPFSAIGPPAPLMTTCIQAVSAAAHAKGLIVSGDVITNWQGPWWAPSASSVDQYNLMTYGDSLTQLKADVQTTINQGLPASKFVVGIDVLDSPDPPPGGCGQFSDYAAGSGLKGVFVWPAVTDTANGNVCTNALP